MPRLVTRSALLLVVGLAALGLTACNKYGLTGHIDSVSNSELGTTVEGWVNAADPAFSREGWTMVLFVDGVRKDVTSQGWTSRPDVVTAIGPNSWGFSLTAKDLPFGTHEICVDAVPKADAPTATKDSFLECTTSAIPAHRSAANIENVVVAGDAVGISGWVYSSPYAVDGPWDPAVTIDGAPVAANFVTGDRPDVVAAFAADPAAVFSVALIGTLTPGPHELCLGTVPPGLPEVSTLACVNVQVVV